MQVFKLSMKILKKNASTMSIYFGIFILVSIMMMSSSSTTSPGVFQTTKTRVAFFPQENTALVQGLKEALSENAVFVSLEDDPEALQDALYFRQVEYILRVPQGFTEGFLSGEPVQLTKTSIPDSTTSVYIDMKVDRYLQSARTYATLLPDLAPQTLANYVLEDMTKEAEVTFETGSPQEYTGSSMQFFFNYMSYTFMFVLILGVSILMLATNDPNIKRRNACSPIKAGSANLQVFLSILVFALIAWVLLVGLSLFFGRKELGNPNTVYFVLNSLLFAGTTAGVSYLIANLVKGRESIAAVANIVTLGSSFISGVFVPQELISESVLRIASFLPTYWFVRGNRFISTMVAWGTDPPRD
ncbi:ABC transporter permease [Alkalibacter rhizosphaerae]|uniref:ABC transporter permease n=1 Tax=Alkalibacter rhizosphaerae TaxID=2815577 RepID=A0A974XD50_9FIRM|nr:ABC transporter permease [Alkalibacter rhizosphaerae]QSX07619.1 ABC transporter permease [Alkalibacter rhizosphaerae]